MCGSSTVLISTRNTVSSAPFVANLPKLCRPTELSLPDIVKFMAKSQEMLFLFAVGWGFGVASLFQISGFTIEIGALFAGVALAGLPYAQEIEARLKPLRDFFVVLYFIVLGKSLSLAGLSH